MAYFYMISAISVQAFVWKQYATDSYDVMLPVFFNMTAVLTVLELLPPSNRSAYDICNLTLMFRKHLIEEACLLSIVVVMTIDSVNDKKQHPIWLLAIFII